MISIETVIEAGEWRSAVPAIEDLARRAHEAAAGRTPGLDGAVALLLADDARLADLNLRFRGQSGPTNVLSFPSGDAAPAFLGDIALGFETCAGEALEKGAPLADHAAHLIVHGLLHLIGHDHRNDQEALVMEALEAEILAQLGIENPYGSEMAD